MTGTSRDIRKLNVGEGFDISETLAQTVAGKFGWTRLLVGERWPCPSEFGAKREFSIRRDESGQCRLERVR